MVSLRPFVGLVPTSDVLARSVAGSARGAQRLARRASHPRHVSWLEGGDVDRPANVDDWLDDRSLRADDRPRLRLHIQHLVDGTEVIGVLGLVPIGDLVPHEGTDGPAVRRRVQRDRTQQVDSRPLLTILPADPPAVASIVPKVRMGPVELDVRDDTGVRHTTYVIDDDDAAALIEAVAPLPCLLADGHHRVAAAAALGRVFVPAFVTFAAHAPQRLPVWRLAAVTRAAKPDVAAWLDALPDGGPDAPITVRFDGKQRRLALTPGELGVEATQRLANGVPGVQRVTSTPDVNAVAVAERDGAVAIGCPPPTVTEVLGAVAGGRPLPPKSTAFHPKPFVGLVMNRIPEG